MLEVEDLSVSYGGVAALDGVSLRIPNNGITAVLGPNGAGKSSACRQGSLSRPAADRNVA
jgi:ABC-type multidrug transport system ATPase subunit